MLIYPAIDIINKKAVRLYKGDYDQKTVYSDDPAKVAMDFLHCGAKWVHLVDLDGARSGSTVNFDVICRIKEQTDLCCEVGGGIRTMDTVDKYLDAGIDRVIIGTAAVKDPEFLKAAVAKYGDRIAVGVDQRDGYVAVQGWTETVDIKAEDFCREMQDAGVSTIICTDVSKDGAMNGTNLKMYHDLSKTLGINIIASGGISSINDIIELRKMDIHGAIIGKAYYTGDIPLAEAIEVAK